MEIMSRAFEIHRRLSALICGQKTKGRWQATLFRETKRDQRTSSGTMRSATMLMILMSGFTAGPAVSL